MPTKEELDRLEALRKNVIELEAVRKASKEPGHSFVWKAQCYDAREALNKYHSHLIFYADDLIQAARRAEALEACALKYLAWHSVESPKDGLESDLRNVDMCGDKALKEST